MRFCTLHTCFFACRGGSRYNLHNSFSPCHEGRECSPHSSVSACREGRGCTPRSRFSSCRGDRGCTPPSCFSACREGRGCTPCSCALACREDTGCTPRSCQSFPVQASLSYVTHSPCPTTPRAAMCGRVRTSRQSLGKKSRGSIRKLEDFSHRFGATRLTSVT